jgi:peptidoglycan/xylan/chitin deacetylase (PgdA/CDA1 family)
MAGADPDLYDYSPIVDRPRLTWPDAARVAVWLAPNLEFYELDPPVGPARTPWPRPHPDVLGYTLRDYGNRAGVWRLLEVLDRHRVRGSVALNVALCDHHPEIVQACAERGWEFFSHGVYNTRYAYGMDETQERALIEDAIATVERLTGARLRGWLSPALSNTERTPHLLAEYGIRYSADFFHDDQPFPLKVRRGRLISLPYSIEVNDGSGYLRHQLTPRQLGEAIRAQFDRLYAEGAESGRVLCVPLHPFLTGQPHRLPAFADALAHIVSHDRVWLATGAEIAEWYHAHHYDAMVAHLAVRRAPEPAA